MGFFSRKLPDEYTTKLAKEAKSRYGLSAELKQQLFAQPESKSQTRQRTRVAREDARAARKQRKKDG